MATSDYLDESDLRNIDAGGFVNEDLIQKIYDSSVGVKPILLPMLETVSVSNSYKEWAQDELAPPTDSRVVSGSDAGIVTETMSNAIRLGNHAQTNLKVVNVSERALNISAVTGNVLEYKTRRKMMELQRDMEAHLLGVFGSVQDDGNTTPGRTAGLGAWLETNTLHGTGGSPGGFKTQTKTVSDLTPGEVRKASLADVRTIVHEIYINGGAASGTLTVMSVPSVIKALSEAVRADNSGAFVAPRANVSGSGGGVNQTAQGWTDTIYTDYGITLKLVANRLQPVYDSGDSEPQDAAALYFLDLEYLAKGYLHDIKVEPLAKIGLSHRRQISVDWMSLVLLERALGAIFDIDVEDPF